MQKLHEKTKSVSWQLKKITKSRKAEKSEKFRKVPKGKNKGEK